MEDIIKYKSLEDIPSDLIKKAQQLCNTREGKNIIQELKQSGLLLQQPIDNKPKIEHKNAIVIGINGQIKTKLINVEQPEYTYVNLTINNIDIVVLYDHTNKLLNKKASKMLKYNVYGVVMIYGLHEDVKLEQLK